MPDVSPDQIEELNRRIELLEADNQRLRAKIEPIFGPDNPCFDPIAFMRALRKPIAVLTFVPTLLIAIGVPLMTTRVMQRMLPPITVLGVPLVDIGGQGTRHPGLGIGIIAVGGAGIGVIGLGGLGVGVIAMGGGAIGLIAFGGGSLGLIAVGGGACGYIAVGGGTFGYYCLGQRGFGKHVLAFNRQDDPAIEFFCRFVPGLRAAVTRPMPVIPVAKATSAA